jgi:capsular exopolysaccharide synthesis family protein
MNPPSVTEAFMDGIQTYRGSAATPNSIRSGAAALTVNPSAVKTASNYFKALRRRFWMVLAIAVPLAISSSIVVLRLPPVYLVKAEIEINPPEVPPELSTLVSHELGRRDPSSQASYVPNHEVWLRNKWLAELVVNNSAIAPELTQYVDPAAELFKSLTVVPVKKGTNSFIVSLEGPDPSRTKRLLEKLLEEFQYQAKRENENRLDAAKDFAKTNLTKLVENLDILDKKIGGLLKDTPMIGPHGRSMIEEQYVNFGSMLAQKRQNMDALQQHVLTSQLLPKIEFDGASSARAAKIAQLEEQIQVSALQLEHIKGLSRNFDADPSAKMVARRLELLMDKRDKLLSVRTEAAASPIEPIMERFRQEIEADQDTQDKLLTKMQESLPDYQKFQAMLGDRADKKKQIVAMEDRLTAYEIVEKAIVTNDCVKVPPNGVVEPTVPIKPNRALLIGLGLFVSFGLAIGLVCLLEHVDHSVKVPEHVTHGLTLPLLGVVPRIRRTALTHRGGHLWTPATPDSLEADAYRNIRASLLGIADRRGPIITLLVTSAKAGEGKSTTAINLAATCARAGERTVLMDIDLRRPSLADVFIENESTGDVHGLIDVLRGDLPWQRTVRHTEIPNLDFIPTGDTRSIPIEILGTRELRQLLIGLSNHYDRVILDGPAVLGLADCRVLGRIVDAALLVVRSGSHQLMTLHRAKAMLEQSHVVIAGVVFNGLTDDMNNWSSYGYDPLPLSGGKLELITSG